MSHAPDLLQLRAPFAPDDVEWKPGAVTRDRKKGLAMAYITSRAIQDRLDDVCTPANWRNEFREGPMGGVLCGISVNVVGDPLNPQWVTKWDGAENTEVEAIKGGLSGAMKRAAVQWGIGRYLYDMPAQWVSLNEKGRFAEPPRIPAKYLPRRDQRPASNERSAPQQRPQGSAKGRSNGAPRSNESSRSAPSRAGGRPMPQNGYPAGDVMR